MAVSERYTRVLIFGKKKSSLTLEEYYEHWSKVHAPLVSPLLKRIGTINYSQIRITPETKTALEPLGPAATVGASYDGYASFLVKDLGQFMAGFQDPEYLEKVKPDEDSFIDRASSFMLIAGYEEVFF